VKCGIIEKFENQGSENYRYSIDLISNLTNYINRTEYVKLNELYSFVENIFQPDESLTIRASNLSRFLVKVEILTYFRQIK
jgi:hypothetical protein